VGLDVLTAVVLKSTIFWDITPCSPLKVNRRFGGIYCLNLHRRIALLASCFLVSCLAYSSTLEMEASCSSEMSVDFQRSTRRYISEDSTLVDNSSPLDCVLKSLNPVHTLTHYFFPRSILIWFLYLNLVSQVIFFYVFPNKILYTSRLHITSLPVRPTYGKTCYEVYRTNCWVCKMMSRSVFC
jgi:hypothetical protein